MARVVRWLKSSQSEAIKLSSLRKQSDVAENSEDEFDHETEDVSNVSLKHTEGKLTIYGKLINTTAGRLRHDSRSR